ncbi:MAG: DUF885 domain-containing protein [Gammaproteobacteria bacterium]|nr:DUF885 domain-containing protein [Gammaproteobacteria bacterium]
MRLNRLIAAIVSGALMLAGCSQTPTSPEQSIEQASSKSETSLTAPKTTNKRPKKTVTKRVNNKLAIIKQASIKANQLFNNIAKQSFNRSVNTTVLKKHLQRLSQINPKLLNKPTQLSYQLIKTTLELKYITLRWSNYNYPLSPANQDHLRPINQLLLKKLTSQSAIDNYIKQLTRIKPQMLSLTQTLRDRELAGVMLPYFVFEQLIDESVAIITGAPFDQGDDSLLLNDFKNKLSQLTIEPDQQQRLISAAEVALTTQVKSGYSTLISYLRAQQSRASHDDGVWKFPRGAFYYQQLLQQATTSTLSATELHHLGQAEIISIHSEIRNIMANMGFTGDISQFFEYIRTDPKFNFTRASQHQAAIATTTAHLNKIVPPMLPALVSWPVEANVSSQYANNDLYNSASVAKYQLAASLIQRNFLGHHLQTIVTNTQQQLPKFRKSINFPAYSQGWALYSARLAEQFKLYSQPHDNLGRLTLELWHASKLVIDTGIHSQQWTREQAIEFLTLNTAAPVAAIIKTVTHSIVAPAQATAPFFGMLTITELRQTAQHALAKKFDLVKFHDALLQNGQLPLPLLRQQIQAYIKSSK